jgi:16S rRNA U516 pseudouridylate synthase RsuA-like enzyme
MTATIGYPTLRLLRVQIGNFQLGNLPPSKWKELTPSERDQVLSK